MAVVSLARSFSCYQQKASDGGRIWNLLHHKSKKTKGDGAFCMVFDRMPMGLLKSTEVPLIRIYGAESLERENLELNSSGKQLKVLDSYFNKLQDGMQEKLSSSMATSTSSQESDMTGMLDTSDQHKAETGLGSLEKYFGKLNSGMKMENSTSSTSAKLTSERNQIRMRSSAAGVDNKGDKVKVEANDSKDFRSVDSETGQLLFSDENFEEIQTFDEPSDFGLISIMAALNIGVFFFEMASPIRNSDVEKLSLPLIYGAKVNKLILDGEWWRLLTPMFLHSGFLHVCLDCWVLLTFAPQVCRGYGPFTFFLIYIFGGICGNLTSFIRTPELTVCGTAPIFAIIGAWFVYQIQNKTVIPEEVSESMFWKAVITTVLSFLMTNFGRIDDWTHLGAMFSGIVFSFLVCPSLQLDNASTEKTQEKGIAFVQPQADPCKSLLTFTISLLLLSFLVFNFDPQIEMWDPDDFIE